MIVDFTSEARRVYYSVLENLAGMQRILFKESVERLYTKKGSQLSVADIRGIVAKENLVMKPKIISKKNDNGKQSSQGIS